MAVVLYYIQFSCGVLKDFKHNECTSDFMSDDTLCARHCYAQVLIAMCAWHCKSCTYIYKTNIQD